MTSLAEQEQQLDLARKMIWCTVMQGISSQSMGGPSASYIYMHCARSRKRIDVVYQYARHLCSIDRGVHLPPIYIYIHCARSRKKTDVVYWYARHLCLIEGGPSAFGIYMCLVYIYIYIYIIYIYI